MYFIIQCVEHLSVCILLPKAGGFSEVPRPESLLMGWD